ncbi:MAG TPA: hypothetical protein VGL57_00275 [Solirubrobacteraceae bacterium]|jgi:hypothetical protein
MFIPKLASGKPFEFLVFAPSKEFLLSVSKRRLKKNQKSVVTVTATIAGAEAKSIDVFELPKEQFEEVGAALCEGVYAAAKEECKFEVEYIGNEEAVALVELEDKAGNDRRRAIEGGP